MVNKMGQVLSGYESLRGGSFESPSLQFIEYLTPNGLSGGTREEEIAEQKRRDALLLSSVTEVTYPIVDSEAENL